MVDGLMISQERAISWMVADWMTDISRGCWLECVWRWRWMWWICSLPRRLYTGFCEGAM